MVDDPKPQQDPVDGSAGCGPVTWYEAVDVRPARGWLLREVSDRGLILAEGGPIEWSESYLDTDDCRLRRAGIVLAVVIQAGVTEASLEVPPHEDGAGRLYREPMERPSAPLDGNGPVACRVRALCGGRTTAPRVQVRVRERAFAVSRDGQKIARLLFREVEVPVDGNPSAEARGRGRREAPVTFGRIGIDVFDGDEGAALARSLIEGSRLRAVDGGLYPAALVAASVAALAPLELGPRQLGDSPMVGEVAFVVLRKRFAQFLRCEPGTRLGDDIEALHDMRVATRRMRAALRLFDAHLPAPVRALNTGLSWVGKALGEVRDLDVHLVQIVGWRAELAPADRPALDALEQLLVEQRAAARARMLKVLDSHRYGQLVARIARLLAAGPGRGAAVRRPVLEVAPRLIDGRFERVFRLGSKILNKKSRPERYHRLRARVKAVRYAIEFHAGLYDKPARRMIQALVELQDLLGEQQDAVVALSHIRDLVETEHERLPPHTLFVVGMLAERYERRARKLRRGFPPLYERVRGGRYKALNSAMAKAMPRVDPPSDDASLQQ